MAITLNIANTKEAVLNCFMANPPLVPLIQGPPGVGKSDMIKQVAKELNLKVIDVRLAQCEPNDLLGYPSIIDGRTTYVPMDVFPLQTDEPPAGYDGWILFLDEIRNANINVQMAAYRIILDHEVGNYPLSDKCLVVAAGNREADGCFVPPMTSALKSRMIHLETNLDYQEWINWAMGANIDSRITAYLQFKPEALQTEYVDSKESSYGCGRTWEFVNRLIQGRENDELLKPGVRATIEGAISSGVAIDFFSFIKYYDSVATYKEVLKDPTKARKPARDDIGLIWATIGMLSGNFKQTDIKPVLTYLECLPEEYQMVFMKEISVRFPKIVTLPEMRPWIGQIAKVLWSQK